MVFSSYVALLGPVRFPGNPWNFSWKLKVIRLLWKTIEGLFFKNQGRLHKYLKCNLFSNKYLSDRSFFNHIILGVSLLSDSRMTVIKIGAIMGYHKMEYNGQWNH